MDILFAVTAVLLIGITAGAVWYSEWRSNNGKSGSSLDMGADKPRAVSTGEYGNARKLRKGDLLDALDIDGKTKAYTVHNPTAEVTPDYPLKETGAGLVVYSDIPKPRHPENVDVLFDKKAVHTIVVGTTGSGKSESLIKPSILTIADSGESMIINDPKGELYNEYSGYLKKKGYGVILLNFAKPRCGDQFNQMENVNTCMQKSIKYMFKYQAVESIIKYLTFIQSNGDINTAPDLFNGTQFNEENKKFATYPIQPNLINFKDKIDLNNGYIVINYLREFYSLAFQDSWERFTKKVKTRSGTPNAKLENEYLNFREEKLIEEAISSLRVLNQNFIKNYFKKRIEYYDKFVDSLNDSSKLKQNSLRTKNKFEDIVEKLEANKDSCFDISMILMYYEEVKEEYYQIYKEEEENATNYAQAIAKMIVDVSQSGGKKGEAIWTETPKALLTALITLLARESHIPNSQHLGSVFSFISELSDAAEGSTPQQNKTKLDLIFDMFLQDDICRLKQSSVRIAGDKTKSSILVSAVSPMDVFSNPSVASQAMRTSFNMKDLAEKPTVIFLNSPGRDENPIFTILTSLFIEQSYSFLVEYVKTTPKLTLPNRVHYLIDELPSLPAIPELGSKVALARSRGIKFNFVVQSFSQLDANYRDDKKAIMENCSWMYLLTNDADTAKTISDRCGKYTAEIHSNSNSKNDNGSSSSESTSKMGREIYTPNELQEFKTGTGVYIKPGNPCAEVNLLPAFKFPQNAVAKSLQEKDLNVMRPNEKVDFFVPDPIKFRLAYSLFHNGYLLDDIWYQFIIKKDTKELDDSTKKPVSEDIKNRFKNRMLNQLNGQDTKNQSNKGIYEGTDNRRRTQSQVKLENNNE